MAFNDVNQVLKTKTKTSSTRYDLSHHSDGRVDLDNRDPVTKEDWKIHDSHLEDSIYYNVNHAHDHLEELVHSWKKIQKDDPAKAKQVAKFVVKTLNHCLKELPMEVHNG